MLQNPFYHRLRLNARRERNSSKGFTLIELLIVIAIILILIAIALPNFLEAQIRARVTKAKGEIRSLGIALESYAIDFKVYPSESEHDCGFTRGRFECGLRWLTSPIAYITDIPEDPFPGTKGGQGEIVWYEMGGINSIKAFGSTETWALFTQGPDGEENEIDSCCVHYSEKTDDGSVENYSATNGTKSKGDIFLYGGDGFWIGIASGAANKTQNLPIDPLRVDGVDYLHRLPIDSL